MNNITEIIEAAETIVCDVFNITRDELVDNRKFRTHTDARSVLFHLLHVKYSISFYRLAKIYNKHHSIIIRAVNKCEHLNKYDKDFKYKYHMCELRLENSLK